MNEQEKITKAALVYGVANAYTGVMAEVTQDNTAKWAETDFKAGASYYRENVMPEHLAKAMEWISLKELYQEIDGRWYDKFGGKVRMVAETTKDLLVLFEKYKRNQDAG